MAGYAHIPPPAHGPSGPVDFGLAIHFARPHPLRRNQLHRLTGLPEHLKQHLGLGLEQGDPVLQIGGMALELTADLQPIAQGHGP